MGGAMTAELSKEELINIVDEIFGSMAGMPLTPADSDLRPEKQNGYIVSAVQIVGDWQGAVRLDINMELARHACSRLLGVDPAELSHDDIRDAAGELANMIGGSVKTLLAPTCSLSLPSVVMGFNFEFAVLQGKVMLEVCFTHESGRLLVSIMEKHAGV